MMARHQLRRFKRAQLAQFHWSESFRIQDKYGFMAGTYYLNTYASEIMDYV